MAKNNTVFYNPADLSRVCVARVIEGSISPGRYFDIRDSLGVTQGPINFMAEDTSLKIIKVEYKGHLSAKIKNSVPDVMPDALRNAWFLITKPTIYKDIISPTYRPKLKSSSDILDTIKDNVLYKSTIDKINYTAPTSSTVGLVDPLGKKCVVKSKGNTISHSQYITARNKLKLNKGEELYISRMEYDGDVYVIEGSKVIKTLYISEKTPYYPEDIDNPLPPVDQVRAKNMQCGIMAIFRGEKII